MGTRWRLAAVLLLAAAFRLANLSALAHHPLAEYQASWAASDMGVNVRWADGIRHGDLLCRQTVHPFYPFHEAIAPRETWERWWGGARVFQQAPLYAYLLAGVRALGGDGFWPVAIAQLALGLASVALVFLVARRVFGEDVATLAGALAATYGPLVFHEAVWLRDTLAVTTSLLALWTLSRAEDGGRARWLAAGLALAAAVLTRETALLFVPFALAWAWRRLAGARARGFAALAAGLVLGALPLVARNVAVGAPALSFSNRGLETFVQGHAADGSTTDLVLPRSAKEILVAADGSLLRAMELTLATHGSVGHLVGWELRKTLAILASYEPADNVNWYYFEEQSPVLRLSPGLALVLALGLVGLVLERRRGAGERLLRWFLLASFLGLLYGILVARYRLAAVAVLAIYAAAALVGLVERVRARRWAPAAGIALAACALALVSTRLNADVRAQRAHRLTEPTLAAQGYLRRQEPELALGELRTGLAQAWREPGRPALSDDALEAAALLVRFATRAGRGAEVRSDVDALVAEFPDDARLRRIAADYYRDVLHDPEHAAEHLRAAERPR